MPEEIANTKPVCPVCLGITETHFWLRGYRIEACSVCTHQFADVTPSESHVAHQFDDKYFYGGGTSGYADYLASSKLLREHGARYAKIIDKTLQIHPTSEKTLLDVGCAAGFIMQGFTKHGWSPVGLDPNDTMVDHARNNGQHAHVGTLETAFSDSSQFLNREPFELVTLIQVAAHISNLPKAMDNLRRLVRADGHVLVETWNSASLTAKALGTSWHEYSPPNVLHYFSTTSLDRLFRDAGFSQIAGGRPIKRIDVGHARSIFDYKYGKTKLGKAMLNTSKFLPSNIAIPYPSEDLFWRIYRNGV